MYGVKGLSVRFVVHYTPKALAVSAGKTDATGVACAQRPIDTTAPAGARVVVDIYAGSMHTRATFTLSS
jgi:hypothetical protein